MKKEKVVEIDINDIVKALADVGIKITLGDKKTINLLLLMTMATNVYQTKILIYLRMKVAAQYHLRGTVFQKNFQYG